MSLNIPETGKPRVVIVGGGFAGLTLAKKLSGSGYQIVMIDRNNFHKFQPLLYQVATASLEPADIAFPLRKVFRHQRGVHFRMAEVMTISAPDRRIITSEGELSYDFLVLATGSSTNFFGIDSIEANALTMKEIPDSAMIRNRIISDLEKAMTTPEGPGREPLLNVVIVGGGPSGVELAGALAEMKRSVLPRDYPELNIEEFNIVLIEGADRLIGTMSRKTSEGTLKILRKMGVDVRLGATATGYRDGAILLKDGTRIPTATLVWTSGVKVDLPPGLEMAENSKAGRILTDRYLKVTGYEGIYAIGDCSWQKDDTGFPGGYPQLAREAISQAKCVARNLKSEIKGSQPRPYRHRDYPILATVGRNKAFAEFGKFRLSGFAAWVFWAGVHIVSVIGVRNRLSVFFSWAWNYFTSDNPARLIIKPELSECRVYKDDEVAEMNTAADSSTSIH